MIQDKHKRFRPCEQHACCRPRCDSQHFDTQHGAPVSGSRASPLRPHTRTATLYLGIYVFQCGVPVQRAVGAWMRKLAFQLRPGRFEPRDTESAEIGCHTPERPFHELRWPYVCRARTRRPLRGPRRSWHAASKPRALRRGSTARPWRAPYQLVLLACAERAQKRDWPRARAETVAKKLIPGAGTRRAARRLARTADVVVSKETRKQSRSGAGGSGVSKRRRARKTNRRCARGPALRSLFRKRGAKH